MHAPTNLPALSLLLPAPSLNRILDWPEAAVDQHQFGASDHQPNQPIRK